MSNMDDPGRFAVSAAEHISQAALHGRDDPVALAGCAQAEALLAVAAAIEDLVDKITEINLFGS